MAGVGKTVYDFSGAAARGPGEHGDAGSSRTLFAERDLNLHFQERPHESNLRSGKGMGLFFLAAVVVIGGGLTFGLVAMNNGEVDAKEPAAALSANGSTHATTAASPAAGTSTAAETLAATTSAANAQTNTAAANAAAENAKKTEVTPAQPSVEPKKTAPSKKKAKKETNTTPTGGGIRPKKPPKKGTSLDDLPDPD
jgi:hypothetical protein